MVVVVLDTVRPDALGIYGNEREPAPFLAELARRSVVFTDAVSTSGWTAPATASLFTGLHPLRHGVTLGMVAHQLRQRGDGAPRVRLNRLDPRVETLPTRLSALGYRTFGIATNPNIGPEIGFSRGFDTFTRLERRPLEGEPVERVVGGSLWRWGNAQEVYEVFRSWLGEIRESRPFLLYLHLNDAHDPYAERLPWYLEPEQPSQRARAAYESEIGFADDALRRIFRDLALSPRDVVVVLSDHGEAFGEHRRRRHARGLYRELNHIALLVSAPGLGVRPRRVSQRVSLMSVVPTILELLGEPLPEGLDGLSLVPLLREGDTARRQALERELAGRVLVAHREEMRREEPPTWAVMKGPWTLIREGGRTELYDMDADPRQERDVAAERPEVVADLERELGEFRTRMDATGRAGETVEMEVDPGTAEGLEALGYVVEDDGS